MYSQFLEYSICMAYSTSPKGGSSPGGGGGQPGLPQRYYLNIKSTTARSKNENFDISLTTKTPDGSATDSPSTQSLYHSLSDYQPSTPTPQGSNSPPVTETASLALKWRSVAWRSPSENKRKTTSSNWQQQQRSGSMSERRHFVGVEVSQSGSLEGTSRRP